MFTEPCFSVDHWSLKESPLKLDLLPQSESVFALANGHLGWRGNLDEGEPHGIPGSYLNGLYEAHPLPYPEGGYGYPESGQTAINVTNGKVLRLLVGDEPFDLRYGRLHSHERTLDLRSGLLLRHCEWTSPAGSTVRVHSTRLVSFTQRAIAAVAYEVEAVDAPVRVVVQSELIANEQLPAVSGDPRTAAVLESPLESEENRTMGNRLLLVHSTRMSKLRMATATDHTVDGPAGTRTSSESTADVARLTVTSRLGAGEKLRIEKLVAYGWSGTRSLPAVRDQVEAALAAASSTRWDGLVEEQRDYLRDFWARSDVEVDGDDELQQAVRFALFHVLQAGARAEQRPIPGKGLTGTGYDGHTFWDTETFVLPLLTYTSPGAVVEALRWRQSTLAAARNRARQLGLRGAAFPWRTIDGSECSAYWPAGTAAFHINADIADSVIRYVSATGDEDFARSSGLELLVETARLWMSLGHHDHRGAFHIDGVTGPDEYSAVVNDNTYTNLMAARNLRGAAHAVDRYPDEAADLSVDDEEAAAWRAAAESMHVPYNADLGVHEQHAGSTDRQPWDFAATHPDQYPLMFNFPYFDIYRKQVVKQADLVLAMCTCGECFDAEHKARNFGYYESFTVRDSSLSACCQAVLAAEVGHGHMAYEYAIEAALIDLDDLHMNTRDGLHIASLAGTWMALVGGFGGMRHYEDTLVFAPRLPQELSRLAFHMNIWGRSLRVEITGGYATYLLLTGEPMSMRHHGEVVTLAAGSPTRCPIPDAPAQPSPDRPPNCRPGRGSPRREHRRPV